MGPSLKYPLLPPNSLCDSGCLTTTRPRESQTGSDGLKTHKEAAGDRVPSHITGQDYEQCGIALRATGDWKKIEDGADLP